MKSILSPPHLYPSGNVEESLLIFPAKVARVNPAFRVDQEISLVSVPEISHTDIPSSG